jgi:hypothetical protein
MDGSCAAGSINTNGESTTLIYVDGTQGWTSILDSTTNTYGSAYITATGGTIITCGDYKIHTFTSDATFCVSCAGNSAGSNTVDYLVVAGGGGGGNSLGGGGGAGGYRESSGVASGCYSVSPLGSGVSALPVSVQGYPVTVGAGGAADAQGSNSIFSTITSAGGGFGGKKQAGGGNTVGAAGGSGGGQRSEFPCSANSQTPVGGAGNTPPVSPPQGNTGGRGFDGSCISSDQGGGGGATAVGGNAGPPAGPGGGPGGAGATSSINGTPTARAGGGGGSSDNRPPGSGTAGGGNGGIPANSTGTAGTANTGGGGGGGGQNPSGAGGAGGSGIVIIRYKFQN